MVKVFNTLTEEKERFFPIEKDKIKMYVCGPTVYDDAHIGHARSAVVFDIVIRWLEYRGYEVIVVRNYTDIDDKIIKRAMEKNAPWEDIAQKYIDSFEDDMRILNIKEPTFKPRVTRHISEIIDMIKGLIEKGFAYESGGDVYFSVKKFPEYGKLSRRKIDELLAGARIAPGDRKKDPLDFALWKASEENEPGWNSPWGKGRPGWHIECSAMSMKYLGETMDIHGGGLDLIFPHHENEIAQSETYTGKPFVKYWMHNGFVMVNSEKMSKSLGNFFTVKEILSKFPPDVLRLFLLTTHYRSPIDFSFERLNQSKAAFERLKNIILSKEIISTLSEVEIEGSSMDVKKYKELFESAMDDDFNTAKALGVLFELGKEINKRKDKAVKEGKISTTEKKTLTEGVNFIEEALKILGFRLFAETEGRFVEDKLINLLIEIREDLRKGKNFILADKIRDRLKEIDVVLEDLPSGTIYKRGE